MCDDEHNTTTIATQRDFYVSYNRVLTNQPNADTKAAQKTCVTVNYTTLVTGPVRSWKGYCSAMEGKFSHNYALAGTLCIDYLCRPLQQLILCLAGHFTA